MDRKLSINCLILLAIDSVINSGQKCTFEKLLQECFRSFPEAFGFRQMKQWPDARKLDRPLRALRGKKLARGTPETFFTLTKTGKKLAQKITELFRQKKLI